MRSLAFLFTILGGVVACYGLHATLHDIIGWAIHPAFAAGAALIGLGMLFDAITA